jgi:hypothetical protein
MRWQRRLKNGSSEDQPPRKARFTFSASIFRRATNQPAIQNRSTYVKRNEMLVIPAQRFGERHPGELQFSQATAHVTMLHPLAVCHSFQRRS